VITQAIVEFLAVVAFLALMVLAGNWADRAAKNR